MKRRMYISAMLCAVMMMSALSFSSAAEKVSVSIMLNRAEIRDEELEEFEKMHPDIDVDFIESDSDRLTSMIAAGSPPNVVRLPAQSVPFYAVRNLLVPIDDFIAESTMIKRDDLEPVADYFRYDIDAKEQGVGPLYGLPKDYSLVYDFFYRKDLLESAGVALPSSTEPMSYEEYYAMLEKLVVREGDRTNRWAMDGMLNIFFEVNLNMFLAQKGMALYEDNMERVNLVNNPEAVKIAQFFYDVAKNRLAPSPNDPAEVWLGPSLGTESPRMAIYQYGYWAGAAFNKADFSDQIGYAPGPLWGDKWLNGGLVTGVAIFDSGDEAINAAAWKLFEFFTAGAPAEARAKTGWGLPIFKSMRELVPQESEMDKARLAITLKQQDDGRSFVVQGNPWALEPVNSVWNKYWGEVLADNMSFNDFLETVEREANDLIMDGLYTVE